MNDRARWTVFNDLARANANENVVLGMTLAHENFQADSDFLFKAIQRLGLPADQMGQICDDVSDNYYETYKNSKPPGSKMLTDVMHTHPLAMVSSTWYKWLMERVDYALRDSKIDAPDRPYLEKVLSYWNGANTLKNMHRFVDVGRPPNVSLGYPVLPTLRAFNFNPAQFNEDPDLAEEMRFQILFVRSLHLPGLIWYEPGEEDGMRLNMNANALTGYMKLLISSRALLRTEHMNIPSLNAGASNPMAGDFLTMPINMNGPTSIFQWLRDTRWRIENIFHNMLPKLTEPIGLVIPLKRDKPDMDPFTVLMKQVELEPQRLLQVLHQELENQFANLPFERLVFDLLNIENTFESLLSDEHVEDQLIDKQISVENINAMAIHPEYINLEWRCEDSPAKIERVLWKAMKHIGLLNRQRRNWKVYKDWKGQRPWARMYQMYDTRVAETAWQRQPILDFRATKNYPPGFAGTYGNGTHVARIQQLLFDVWPHDLADGSLPPNTKPHNLGSSPEELDSCGFCRMKILPAVTQEEQDLEAHPMNEYFDADSPLSNTMTELRCGHGFHTLCIFKFWDRPGAYSHQCPICGDLCNPTWVALGLQPFDYNKRLTTWKQGRAETGPGIGPGNSPNDFMLNLFSHSRAELLFQNTILEEETDRQAIDPATGQRRFTDQQYRDWQRDRSKFTAALYDLPNTGRAALVNQFPGLKYNEQTEMVLEKMAGEYWEDENALLAKYEEQTGWQHPRWETRFWESGERATDPLTDEYLNRYRDRQQWQRTEVRNAAEVDWHLGRGIVAQGVNVFAADDFEDLARRRTENRYDYVRINAATKALANEYKRVRNQADPFSGVYDVETGDPDVAGRYLLKSGFTPPSVESAQYRQTMRRRNMERRIKKRALRKGFGGKMFQG